MTLLEILQPTNVPVFNPALGRIHRSFDTKGPLLKPPPSQKTELTCRWCGKTKTLDKFIKCNKTKLGVSDTCKRCLSARRKKDLGERHARKD